MILTPEQIAAPHTERSEQMALFAWAALSVGMHPELKWMFAIKNAEKGGAIRGSMAKAEGVKSGVSDIFLPVARHNMHGLFIEMKKDDGKKKGKESEDQKEFGIFANNQGFGYVVCYSWWQARDILIQYLKR
jgi:hypothetical protein